MAHSTDDRRIVIPQSTRAIFQIGLAGLGSIVILGSLIWFVIIFAGMPASESGFAEGLAIIIFGLNVLAGFVILAIGLLVPQLDGGIQFSEQQRKLLLYGAAAPIISVLLVPAGATLAPPLPDTLQTVAVVALIVAILSGPLATLAAILLKLNAHLRRPRRQSN